MGVFVTINKLLKQMGSLYVDLFKEIKKMFKDNIKKVTRSVLMGVGAFSLCALLAVAAFLIMGTYNKYIFTASNWAEYPNDRINMIKSMESQYDFVGMTSNEVEELLGKPNYSTLKANCEYIDLADVEYEYVAQYEINKESRSIVDMIDKNYVVAYNKGKVVYANVLIAD
ncbi:MAG: hypothetical protein E7262_03290 [Lachnospiraceae bacterium]|nr:hypothetical protein [Lachnospiraceae bacterium]